MFAPNRFQDVKENVKNRFEESILGKESKENTYDKPEGYYDRPFGDGAEIQKNGVEDYTDKEYDCNNDEKGNVEKNDFSQRDDGEYGIAKGADAYEEVEYGSKKCYYDNSGEIYRIGNELLPNKKYEINGYAYETDDKGRVVSVEGQLHLKKREGRLPIKDSIEDIGKGDEHEGDDRGHLIGDQFDGSNGMENMIPQNAEINRKDYKSLENELANKVREGKEVEVIIEPVYDGDSRRPSAIVVSYKIDGVEETRIFPND